MLHLPKAYQAGTPLPVLILLHDSRDNGEQIMSQGDFLAHADRHSYIVVAPNALAKSFNDESGRIGPMPLEVDDVGFIDLMIEDLDQKIGTDPAQRFIAGYGSGGSMVQMAVLELRSHFAAAVSISGHLWAEPGAESGVEPGADPAPGPLLLIFGNDDPRNPLAGGSVFYSTQLTLEKPAPIDTAGKWARLLGCSTAVTTEELDATRTHWADCAGRADLDYLEVDHAGPLWPPPRKGHPTLKGGSAPIGSDSRKMAGMLWTHFSKFLPAPQ
jgi:polyhydroxybutyrate depolymerase